MQCGALVKIMWQVPRSPHDLVELTSGVLHYNETFCTTRKVNKKYEEEEEIKLQSLSHETQKKSTHFIQSLNHDETHKKTSILYNHYP